VIDGGGCTNVVFEEACKKLGLKVEPHPSPYKIAWVNNTNLPVQEICLVTYYLGGFIDYVMCDVLHLKVCHILLGRSWLYNKKAQYCGFKNTYSFQQGRTKITMIPCKDTLEVKLKKTIESFLLHRIPKGDDILNTPPRLNGVEFPKRGGVDAATYHYLEKTYPLWKPKPKIHRGKKSGGKAPW